MNPREKRLAMVVGALGGVLALLYTGNAVYDAIASRNRQIANLTKDIEAAQFEIQKGLRIASQLDEYAGRALPFERDLGRSIYQNWLLKLVDGLHLQKAAVNAGTIRPNGDVYEAHSFDVTGVGNLEQLTDLLYVLQYAPLMHRIQRLSIVPIRDKKELDISLTLEALAMPTSPARSEIPRFEPRADAVPVSVYKMAILGRNLFGPENQPPRLSVEGTMTAFRGRPLQIAPRAEDPDKLDTVRIEADVSSLPGARFSNRDGRIDWVPRDNGEYFVVVKAHDDGFPSREVEKRIRVVVQDPPPPPPVTGPPPPSFSFLKLAFITAITEIGGQPQVWVKLGHEGRTVKVRIGEPFRVGNVEATIKAIHGKDVVVEAGGRELTTRLGNSIEH